MASAKAGAILFDGISRKYAWSTVYIVARIAFVCQRRAMNMAGTKERQTRPGEQLLLKQACRGFIKYIVLSISEGYNEKN